MITYYEVCTNSVIPLFFIFCLLTTYSNIIVSFSTLTVLKYFSDHSQPFHYLSKNEVMSNDDSPPDGRFTNHTDRTETVNQMDLDNVNQSDSSQLGVIVEGRSSDPTTHGGDTIPGNVVGRSTDPTKNADPVAYFP